MQERYENKNTKPLRVCLLDYDGCLINFWRLTPVYNEATLITHSYVKHQQAEKAIKEIILDNQNLLSWLIESNANYTHTRVAVGSFAQSPEYDLHHMGSKKSPPRFLATKTIADLIGGSFDPFLLSDIYTKNKIGTNYKIFRNAYCNGKWEKLGRKTFNASKDELNKKVGSRSKVDLLYAHAHRHAWQFPNSPIDLEFYDDETKILDELYTFYSTHTDLLPNNVSLKLNHYTVFNPNNIYHYSPIQGTGLIDKQYWVTLQHCQKKEQELAKKSPKPNYNFSPASVSCKEVRFKNNNTIQKPEIDRLIHLNRRKNLKRRIDCYIEKLEQDAPKSFLFNTRKKQKALFLREISEFLATSANSSEQELKNKMLDHKLAARGFFSNNTSQFFEEAKHLVIVPPA